MIHFHRLAAVCGFVLYKMERKVTSLKIQKNNPNRVNVYLDGEFSFGLARIVAAWLQIGQTIGEEKIAKLQKQDTEETAFQKSIHFISYRPRSEKEIRQKLSFKGYDENTVEAVINRLCDNGLLGDEEFAKLWIENRTAFRPKSRRNLVVELLEKGLADEVIKDAVQNANIDEEALAEKSARYYIRRLYGFEQRKFFQRLNGYLFRKGFSFDIIPPITLKLWTEMKSNEYDKDGDDERTI
jgi:regulatory protein